MSTVAGYGTFLLENGYYYNNKSNVFGSDFLVKELERLSKLDAAAKDREIVTLTEEKIRQAIENGADINATNDQNWTVLHYAAKLNRAALVIIFLKSGADIHAHTKAGFTPLQIAASGDRLEAAQAFLESDAALFESMDALLAKTVPVLKDKGALSEADKEQLAKGDAILQEHLTLIKRLKENRVLPEFDRAVVDLCKAELKDCQALSKSASIANETAIDDRKPYALHIACQFANAQMVKLIMQYTKDLNSRTKHGYAPLHFAAMRDSEEVAKALLSDTQTNRNPIGSDGKTPQNVAEDNNKLRVLCYLRGGIL